MLNTQKKTLSNAGLLLLTPNGAKALLDSLPAASRAKLKWLPEKIRVTVLNPMHGIDVVADLDQQERVLAVELFTCLLDAIPALTACFAGDMAALIRTARDKVTAELAEWQERAVELMGQQGWQSFEWAAMTMWELAATVFEHLPDDWTRALKDELPADWKDNPDLLWKEEEGRLVLQAYLYVVAVQSALDGSDENIPTHLVGEMSLRAYLAAMSLADRLRARGLHVDPFRNDSPQTRLQRFQAVASSVLDGLSDEDLENWDETGLNSGSFFSH